MKRTVRLLEIQHEFMKKKKGKNPNPESLCSCGSEPTRSSELSAERSCDPSPQRCAAGGGAGALGTAAGWRKERGEGGGGGKEGEKQP